MDVKSDIFAPTRDRTRRVADRVEVLAVHWAAEGSLRAFLPIFSISTNVRLVNWWGLFFICRLGLITWGARMS